MSLTIQWGELTAAKKPLQLSGSVDLAEAVKERADLVDAGPLHVQVQATDSSGVARVQGEAEAEFKFQCSRCLEPFKKRIRFPLREMFTKDKSILEAETEELIHLVGTVKSISLRWPGRMPSSVTDSADLSRTLCRIVPCMRPELERSDLRLRTRAN